MRIGIDIRCFSKGKSTGVEEYTAKILENLFELDKKNQYILFSNSFRRPSFDPEPFLKYKNVSMKEFRFPNKLLNFLFWYFRWPHVDKMLGGLDIFFMPNISFVALSKKAKLVLTIHDLSYELCPQTFSLKRRMWHDFINPRRMCQRADHIIAVSDSTKDDIVLRWHIDENKIHRIHNGISDGFEQMDRNDPKLIEVKEKYHLPFNFIFYLGTIEPRKNVPAIVKAFDQMKALNHPQLNRYKLVIAGTKGWKTKDIMSEMRNAKFTDDIIFTDCISNEDKAAVYTLASLFVYPSLFEGFGIPVLEAMRCGLPVITSNVSALPEVAQDGAIMIDPDRPEELFEAMKEILLNRDLSEKLRNRALRQAIRFNWRTSARHLLEIFEK